MITDDILILSLAGRIALVFLGATSEPEIGGGGGREGGPPDPPLRGPAFCTDASNGIHTFAIREAYN